VLRARAKGNGTAALLLLQAFPPLSPCPVPGGRILPWKVGVLFSKLVGTPLLGPRSDVPHPCPSTSAC